ncbi:hypothetical protein EYF80_001812 [Liparis tanakae]|uniref:Uncharacterized protein n=1 Tax=Liparis tanakae TaxID=230148 RepID=A0A4Z2JDW7_9TELE|nr:hypothetical protein EYF80_001812 [Liparis tanakae]
MASQEQSEDVEVKRMFEVFEVSYTCVDCVEVRVTLPLVIAKAHQSHESPQPVALPLHLPHTERGLLAGAGLVLGEGGEDEDAPRVRGTYVGGSIVRLVAGTEHVVCDADCHVIAGILPLTGHDIRQVNTPDPRLLIRT